MIIGIFGPKRSGKGTIGNGLEEMLRENGFDVLRHQFSIPLKELVMQMMLGGPVTYESKFDEYLKRDDTYVEIGPAAVEILDGWLERYGLLPLAQGEKEFLLSMKGERKAVYRWLLQTVGTNIVRARNPHFWTNLCISQVHNFQDIVIIDDGRFRNEHVVIKQLNGLTIGVWRHLLPDDTHVSETEAYEVAQLCDFRRHVPDLDSLFAFIDEIKPKVLEAVKDA